MSVQSVTDAEFEAEVLKSPLPVCIDLWAPWCGPCRSLAPIVEQLSGELGSKVKFVKVNVDENPAIAQAFGVQSIPLMALVKGTDVLDTLLGLRPKPQIADWIESALAGVPEKPAS